AFAPASRDGRPVRVRLSIPFEFAPPAPAAPDVAPAAPAAPNAAPAAAPGQAREPGAVTAPAPAPAAEIAEVVVATERHAPSRGAGDVEVEIGKLAAVPRMDAASLLRLAPGVLLTNAGGLGHPYQIFLRGFDAREG